MFIVDRLPKLFIEPGQPVLNGLFELATVNRVETFEVLSGLLVTPLLHDAPELLLNLGARRRAAKLLDRGHDFAKPPRQRRWDGLRAGQRHLSRLES